MMPPCLIQQQPGLANIGGSQKKMVEFFETEVSDVPISNEFLRELATKNLASNAEDKAAWLLRDLAMLDGFACICSF
jgi:hypothetical protein